MFQKLSIQNYILIDKVNIEFSETFNVITGETGAGKSVLLGALSLISGQRADLSVLKDKSKKCIIEADILLNASSFKSLFKEHDIDFERECVIRREITPSGKSRAFINDTPVILKVLEKFALLFFDLHTQHQNMLVKDEKFRLNLIDSIAKSEIELKDYQNKLETFNTLKKEIEKEKRENKKVQDELDFLEFQFKQLDQAQLIDGEQSLLEEENKNLNHAEEIKQALVNSYHLISDAEHSAISQLLLVEQELSKLSSFYKNAEDYLKRVQSSIIDLQDMAPDLENNIGNIEYKPERIEEINARLNLLMELQHKHKVNSINDLIQIKEDLDQKLENFGNFSFEIEEKEAQLILLEKELNESSNKLTEKRKSAFAIVENQTIESVQEMGMPKARFKITHEKNIDFDLYGQDLIAFLFSANVGTELDDMTKIASGGEISRLMLALKQLLSQSNNLSTLILDEIDTGVSGEVADKMGKLMRKMSKKRQLIVITHLPQIAAKGDVHFKVQKSEDANTTVTHVFELNKEKRLTEIAQLLSGENISKAALENAKELMIQ